VPYSVSGEQVYGVQQLANAGFTDMDIIAVLPLLEDLRAEEASFHGRHAADMVYILASTDMDRAAKDVDLNRARESFRDARRATWSAIRHKIGDQKADVLESLIEPMPQTTTIAYTDPGLAAIDATLAELDKTIASDTVVQTALQANGTVTTASTVTTTETTTMALPITVYSFPPLTTSELVDILQDHLAYVHGTDSTAFQINSGRRLTSEDMTHFRDRRLGMWD